MKRTVFIATWYLLSCISALKAQTYTWTQLADFGGGQRYVPFAFAINGKGYTGSGVTFTGSTANYTATDLWEYDPVTNLWTQRADMPDPCRSSAVSFTAMGGGYVTTGWTPAPVKTTYRYDPVTNTWTQMADFGGAARYTAASFTIGDDAYVGMGYSPLMKDFWKYDSHSNSWTQVANIGGLARQSAVGFSINNIGYVYGGAYSGGVSADLWSYDPGSNTWTQRTSMPGSGRYSSAAVVMGGQGVVGLGTNGTTIFSDFYAYNPVSNSWSPVPALPAGGRYGGASFSISDNGYFVGGAGSFTPTSNLKNDLWVLSIAPSLPLASIVSHEATSCAGDSIELTAAIVPSSTYQWQLNSIDIPGATSYIHYATVAGDYTVVVTNATGSSTSQVVSIPVLPLPALQLSISVAGTDLCSGITLTAVTTPAVTNYQWKLNGVNITGATSQTYQPTSPGNYSFSSQDACGTLVSSPVTISAGSGYPSSVIVFYNGSNGYIYNGAVYACYSQYPFLFSCTAQNASSYQWYRNGVLISGATSANYSVPVPGSYTCVASNSCGSATSNPLVAAEIMQPQPVVNTVGYPNTCNGSPVQLQVSDNGFLPFVSYTYTWSVNGNAIPGNNSPNHFATTPGTYNVLVANNCGWGVSLDKDVFADTPLSPVVTPSGTVSACSGSGGVLLSTQNVSGYQYQWKRNSVAISGATAASYSAVLAGIYTVDVTNACGTYVSSATTVTVVSPPTGSISYQGSNVFCQGTSKLLTCNTSGTVTGYQWNRNGVAISGATSSTYSATLAGNYTVTLQSSGCTPYTTASVSLSVSTVPSPVITVGGSTTICQGQTVNLSVPQVAGETYQWLLAGTPIANATGSTYVTGTAGSYSVQVTNTCGSSTSASVNITVNPSPSAAITYSGSTTFCQGGSVILSATNVQGQTYQWMKNGVNISGATAKSYTATTSGVYTVKVTRTSTGCFSITPSSGSVTVTVNPSPGATITPAGTVSFCAGQSVTLTANTGTGYTYLWKRNNKKIVGATSSVYTVTTAGNYKVTVTSSSGCSSTSPETVATINCREGVTGDTELSVRISPNPSAGDLVLWIDSPFKSGMYVEVFDVFGKLIERLPVSDVKMELRSSQWTAGNYFIKVLDTDGAMVVSRFVKLD